MTTPSSAAHAGLSTFSWSGRRGARPPGPEGDPAPRSLARHTCPAGHLVTGVGWASEEAGTDDGSLQGVAVGGVRGVVAGQGVDAFQPVGQRAHAERQPPGRGGGHATRVEVRHEGVEQRLCPATRLFQRSQGVAHKIHQRLPVAGEDGKDQQVRGAQQRLVEAHALGHVQGVEGLFVAVADTDRAWPGPADGHLRLACGGVGLPGEVGEDVVLVARRDAHHPAVLGREQDATVLEACEQLARHLPGYGVGLVVLLRPLGHGDRVGAGQTKPEPFGVRGELARVTASMEQVVDELPAGGLLLADHEPLRVLVAVGEGVHGLLDDAEDAVRGGRARPPSAGRREMGANQGAPSVSGLGRLCAQVPAGLDLVAGQTPARGGGVGQDPLEAVEVGPGRVLNGHVLLLRRGRRWARERRCRHTRLTRFTSPLNRTHDQSSVDVRWLRALRRSRAPLCGGSERFEDARTHRTALGACVSR